MPPVDPKELLLEIREGVESMRLTNESAIEMQLILAIQQKAYFDNLVKEGFSDEQALRLVIASIQRPLK